MASKMDDYDVIVEGFPSSMSNMKVKIFVEKQIGKGSLKKVVRQQDGHIYFTFTDLSGLQRFMEVSFETVTFGNETYMLSCRYSDAVALAVSQLRRPVKFPQQPHLKASDSKDFYRHQSSPAQWNPTNNNPRKDGHSHLHDMARPEHHGDLSSGTSTPLHGSSLNRRYAETKPKEVYDSRKPAAKGPPVGNIGGEDEKLLYQTKHFWTDLKRLPGEGGTKCILAQNVDPAMHIQAVKMHFESNRRSGGGPVKSIIRMNDGLLIVFENDSDCSTCANTRKQEMESQSLRIFTKIIPVFHERKFVIKGVSARTSVDVLKMFLERCTEDEISPSVCKKQSIPGVYLIEYNDAEFDGVDVDDFLDKISADPLEDHQLQGSRLLHSDCLKVTGVPSTASDDEIRFVLESKRRTAGGPITSINHVKNGNVLVYFENFADAERIYNRFKQPSIEVIVIDETEVAVELYYHSLCEEHEEVVERKIPKPKPKPNAVVQVSGGLAGSPIEFQLKPSCDEKIFFLIKGSKNHFDNLTQRAKDLGRVELCYTPADGCLVKFIPNKKLRQQERYDEQCMGCFQEFASQFVTKSATFDKEKLQKARRLNLHPKLQILQDKDLHPDLKVCWKGDSSTVEITGLKQHVEKLLSEIEDVIDANTVSIPIDEEGYRVMMHCGIIGELRQKYRKVKINCDDEKSVISITGPDRDVHQIQIEALTLRTMAKERKITDLDEFAVQFLLQNGKKAQNVIQDCISASGIKAEFGFDSDEIYIRARNMGEYRKAMNIVHDMVALEILPVTGGRADVIKSNAWKRFQHEMMRNKSQGLYLKPDNSIIMVGMQADVRMLRTKVDTFLNENEIKRDYVQMIYGKAIFILQRSLQFSSLNPIRKAVKCGPTPEYGGGIFTEGIKQNLDAARREINKILETICEQRHTLRDPGIKSYYLGDEGKEFLETTSRVNNCVILVNSPSCEEWIQHAREHQNEIALKRNDNSSSVDLNENLVTVDRDGVKLAVWKIDIIKHRCDAIVNASNKELALLSGGVSGVIKQYDIKNADQIQMEMRAIADSSVGGLMPGDAALTGAGNLPNCKKIVHAVGPRWTDISERHSKPELVLKSCIRKSLEETEKVNLRSLAIPAISCGVFGGVPNICVPLILDAVNDYFNDHKASCIKQVDFVELTNQTVLSEFKKGVLKMGKPIPTNRTKQSKHATTATSSSFLQSFVKLVQGDVAQQNVDVIVNIMAEGHVRKISSGSAISKAIAAAAGQTVENECAQHHGKLSAGSVFKTSSGSLACQEIYHGLLRNYDQTSENTVKRLVKKCLDMADRGRMKSIAFPAIGTGGFSFPPHDVAKWMKDAFAKFTPNYLTAVFIVLHQSNPAASNAFQAEFASPVAAPPPTAAPVSNVSLPSSVKYGPLTVSVIQGDITQQKCDAIVNSTNATFDLSLGLVSTKILQQGGDEIQDEIGNDAKGDFAVTTGGRLPCSHIIHMVTPNDSEDLQTKVVNLLQLADSKSFSSVAIPALGTGKLNMDSATVGLHIRAAIEAFANLNPRTLTLNKVDVIIFDSNMLPQFRETILGTVKKGAWQKFVEGVKQLFYPTAKEEKVETLDLYLYAASKQDIRQTLKCIGNETKKMMHKETIEDPTLDRLTAMENFEIMEIEKKNNVEIEYKSGRYLKHLVLVGLTKNVMKACDAIRSVLRELSEAETFVQYVAWEKQASNGVWAELPSRAAHCLEKAYQEKKGSVAVLAEVQVMEFRFNKIAPETYDLSTLGNDPKGNNPPKIRRRPKEKGEADALPAGWDNMQGSVLKQVPLQAGSAEYQKVLSHLQRTNLPYRTITIERVQSISLYKQYAAKKAEVTKKLQGTNSVVEMELFHGTTNADKIMSNGFDRSFAGANAAVYGNGVYFATQAAYSHGYTRPGSNGMRTMFLANVITGAYAQGSGGLKTPPVKSGLDLYDSVVDNMHSPTMFVIFKDASAYPTYLISYQ